MGHSGGGPHALACGVLLPNRVVGVIAVASLAPYDAEGLDWFNGMAAAGTAELRTAARGRAALEEHLTSTEFDPEQFTPADHQALRREWSWLGTVAEQALEGDLSGMVDDDLALVAPWGFQLKNMRVPVLFLHGDVGTESRLTPTAARSPSTRP
jgi:pimeloyl-ACP methyl ester carboxylesterase